MILYIISLVCYFSAQALVATIPVNEVHIKYHYKKFVVLFLVVGFLGTGTAGLFMTDWA
ncbi:MAG: hypothetical protein WC444_04260 [Candidatus Paceibacterota bacterium]